MNPTQQEKTKAHQTTNTFRRRIDNILKEYICLRGFLDENGMSTLPECISNIRSISEEELLEYAEDDWRVLLMIKEEKRTETINLIIIANMEL